MKRSSDVCSSTVPKKIQIVDNNEKLTLESTSKRNGSDGSTSKEDIIANAETKRILPSEETHKPWIWAEAPDSKNVTENYLKSKVDQFSSSVGKWMIFSNCNSMMPGKNMTFHDYAWSCIQNLVENNPCSDTGLFRAKASTAFGKGYQAKSNPSGVICCYTIDYTDKHLAKKAGDSIRKAYDWPKDMFYKTDEDTYANKYGHLGSKNVSIYKHTASNEMYERESEGSSKWKIVNLET